MAFSLNKVMLIGNLGQDAETRVTTTNKSVTGFSIATTSGYKGKDGNYINETTWHNCVAWELSDFMKEALKKGKKFYVEGRIQHEEYIDKEGSKKKVTKIITNALIPLDNAGKQNESRSDAAEKEWGENQEQPEVNNKIDNGDDLPF